MVIISAYTLLKLTQITLEQSLPLLHIGVRKSWATLRLPAFYCLQGALYQRRLVIKSLKGNLMKGLGKSV